MIKVGQKVSQLTYYLPVLLSFSIPISTAMTNICIALLLLCFLLDGHFRSKINYYWEHPLAPILLALFVLYGVGCNYSIGSHESMAERLSDGFRLTLIPVLGYYLVSEKQLKYSLYAFIIGMSITFIAACLKMYLNVPIGMKYTQAAVFKTHIDTNFFMCLAAFYVFFLSVFNKQQRPKLILIGLLMVYYIFFMSIGRIGYVTFFIIGAYVAHHYFGKKGLGLSLLALIIAGLGIYQLSDLFQQRIDILSQDWDFYQQGRLLESSIGSRLHFYQTSVELMLQKPIFGWGTGSFGEAYKVINQGQFLFTDNPHNEYLRIGVESGLAGLSVLIFLFVRQWQLYSQVPDQLRVLARGTFMLFLAGCFVNSWLIDFSESYFYVVFTALSLSTIKTYRPGDLVEAPLH